MNTNRWTRPLFLAVGVALGVAGTQLWPALHAQPEETKNPTLLHGQDLQVRKAGEAEFTDKTQKYSVECYRDEHNGNLIYISETGSISVVPAAR